jgi:esterase/lipase superfamily enzyme
MLDLSPDVANLVIAAVALLLYLYAWWALRELPWLAKAAARLLLAIALVVPFVLMLTLGPEPKAPTAAKRSMPPEMAERRLDDADRATRPRMRSAPREDSEPTGGSGPPPAGESFAPPGAGAPPPVATAPPPPHAMPAPAAPEAAAPPPAPVAPPAAPSPGQPAPKAAEAPTTRGLGSPPAPAAGAPPPDDSAAKFDIVPVYYGTDRAREPAAARLQYGFERGRRLELGQALVSVPKSHEKPQVERPWSLRIPYFNLTVYEEKEDPDKHFTMREIKVLTREELLAVVRDRIAKASRYKDHAIVFVHGYNTTFDNAVYRTAQIAYDLKFDSAPFVYSWPSGGAVASYTYDRESTAQAEPHLKEFLELVAKESGAKSVSVIAHSMGNQLVLRVLQDLMRATPPGVVLNQLVLAAPDVDRDAFEHVAKAIRGIANGVTLYAAANDRALGVSRRFHGGVPRAGDVPESGPLLIEGIDTIDVTAASTDSLGLNHSGYAENNALVNDIALLIRTGERPPEKRIPILERVKTDKGDFWRYPVGK